MTQVKQRAFWRMHGTVQIKVHVPGPWISFLKKKVQNGSTSLLLVKTTTRIFMIGEATCEVATPIQS